MAYGFLLLLVLLVLNLWTFALFGWDKMCAEDGRWRVSESSLLSLALVGGIGGAYAGRAVFRHKTRKKSFGNALQNIGFFQLVALTFCTIYFYDSSESLSLSESDFEMQSAIVRVNDLAYYANCSDARAAGAAPLYQGQPGYRAPLDRDRDGIACEPYRGR